MSCTFLRGIWHIDVLVIRYSTQVSLNPDKLRGISPATDSSVGSGKYFQRLFPLLEKLVPECFAREFQWA